MLNRAERDAERCCGLPEEYRDSAAFCAPSTQMRSDYSRMAEHYRSHAEAEELGALAYFTGSPVLL
jgi:hypothetical protein